MPYNEEFRWEDAVRKMEIASRTLLREIQAGEEVYQDILRAQGGVTDVTWGRTLFNTAETGEITLSVNATTKVISGPSGGNYFASFRIGRDTKLSGFTNGGNNQTTEVTARTNDSITIGDATGLVDETDTSNAECQENPSTEELEFIDGLQASIVGLHDLYLASS